MRLLLWLTVAQAIAIEPATETLLVHGGPMLPTRIARACRLAPSATYLALAGSEVEMYAMKAEVRRQCPTALPKTRLLHFHANNTADHLACTLKRLPSTTMLTQLAFEYHMKRVQLTSSLVAPILPHIQWFYVGLPNPLHVAWRIRDERDRYLPQVAADVHAALTGPCALDRC